MSSVVADIDLAFIEATHCEARRRAGERYRLARRLQIKDWINRERPRGPVPNGKALLAQFVAELHAADAEYEHVKETPR